jgi:hypothetical protein
VTVNFPTPDWSKLIPDLVGLATTAVGSLVYGAVRGLLLALWSGLFFAIPHNLTDQFGPVEHMQAPLLAVAGAGLVLALALLGLRTYVRGITGNVGGLLDHVLGRILVILPVIGALPWLIAHAIDIEASMARSVALSASASILPDTKAPLDPAQLVALVIVVILGIRLWFKLASNVVHVAVAIVWAPAALATAFTAESSWIASLWIREFVGRLIGALLATIAVGVGMGIALTSSGLIVISLVGGAFLAAADLIDWLARTPGSSLGGVLGRTASMAMLASTAAGRLGASPASVSPAGSTTNMSNAQVARFYGYSSN